MKYPSVFFAISFAWIAVLLIALLINNHTLTFQLYLAGVAFTVIMFIIGFWHNR